MKRSFLTMPELQLHVLPESQKLVWGKIKEGSSELSKGGFYLAGGTGLAMQLGHRQSLDFDFFSQKTGAADDIGSWLGEFDDYILRDKDENTIHAEIHGVKISFIGGYRYDVVNPLIEMEGIKMASVLDIGLMKLLSITHRAVLRDYLDLAIIIRDSIPLQKILEMSDKKYGKTFNRMIPLRALVAFQEVDQEWPVLFDQSLRKSWQRILQTAVKEITQAA